MDRQQEEAMQVQLPDVFIGGYFSRRMATEKPDYGYPKNHLPDVPKSSMTVKSGFMASRGR